MKKLTQAVAAVSGALFMIYNLSGCAIGNAYKIDGNGVTIAYDISGNVVFDPLPVPSGNLNASDEIALPDIYNNGHGWTCTGLAYDASTDTFLVGDIGKELPSSEGFASQLVRVSHDFGTVEEQIPLYTTFASMQDVQGVAVDTSDGTIWFCSPSENLIRHIGTSGSSIGSFSVTQPTGVAYSPADDTFWVLTYEPDNNIKKVTKTGEVIEQYTFAYSDTLDQCFLDPARGYLYIVAGANYDSRNNVYLFDTNTHKQSIACTVDSYSVEGIWIGAAEMIIMNDGYYHSAEVPNNQANVYMLD